MMWPVIMLIMMLQKTPILRVLVHAEFANGVRAGHLLRALIPGAVATVATSHTLTGATAVATNPASPASGTAGVDFSLVFSLTGSGNTPESYSIIGILPPGLTVPNATGPAGNLTLNASSGSITGVPTTAGTFSVEITAFDSPNRGLGTHGSSEAHTLTFVITGSLNTAPAITVQPQPQTVDIGGTAMFSVTVTGSPTPSLQWRKDGVNLAGQTAATLTLTNVQASNAGDYTVFVSNSEGSVTSDAVALTVNLPPAPTIAVNPVAMRSLDGADAFFAVQAAGTGVTYQWRKDGVALIGETNSNLFLPGVSASDAGAYSVRVSNAGGFVDSTAANLTIASTGRVRLVSLSTRAQVGTGGDILIPGFVIGGSGQKNLLVRAVGEKLAEFGVENTLEDPLLNVLSGSTSLALNDDWQDAPDQLAMETARGQVGAFDLNPATKDSSLLVSVSQGLYTAQASGVGATTGVGLVEFYDADPISSNSTFTSISARAVVGTGGNILIPGIAIEGNVAITLLIRAVGPELGELGVEGELEDPEMVLLSGVGASSQFVASNDDWGQNPDVDALEAARVQVGGFPLSAGSRDASMLVVLNPGVYTIQVSGKNSTTGVALVELYRVGPTF